MAIVLLALALPHALPAAPAPNKGPAAKSVGTPAAPTAPLGAVTADAGTLDRLVRELTRKLRGALAREPRAQLDLAVVLRVPAGVPARLARVVRQLLLGRLGKLGLRSYSLVASDARGTGLARRLRGQGKELLLALGLELGDGQLRLHGELSFIGASLWRDLLQPARGLLGFLHAGVRVDAEVRAFLGKASRVRLAFGTRTFPCGRRPMLALAAGDLDGDGRVELVALHERVVRILTPPRGSQTSFMPRAALVLPGKLATVRPRRPIGTLLVADIDGDRKVEVLLRSSAMALASELSFDGRKITQRRELPGIYPMLLGPAMLGASKGGVAKAGPAKAAPAPVRTANKSGKTGPVRLDGKAAVGVDYFRAADVVTADGKAPAAVPAQFYQLKGSRIAAPGGPRYHVGVVDLAGRLHLLDAKLQTELANLANVGVAFDLADLDDDGRLEVIVSTDGELGSDDRIAVYRWDARQKRLRLLWRSARLGARVTAITHGDLDGDGKIEIVAAMIDRRGRCRLLQVD